MDELRKEWDAATSFSAGDTSEKWWSKISAKYSEEGRIFHNYSYLIRIFSYYHKYLDKLKDPRSVSLAIFFHKYYYDPRESDTDPKIAGQFEEFMSESGDGHDDIIKAVLDLLTAAATNLTEAHMTPDVFGNDDVHYFLDFTMGILGSEPDDYDAYSSKIKEEYPHLSSEAFTKLRIKILQSLLLIPNVYATKEFREELEKKARTNIQKEIDCLKK